MLFRSAAGTGVSGVVTNERRTGISRCGAGIKRFITVLGTGAVETIIKAGIAGVNRAASATTRVGTVTEYCIITGITVIGITTAHPCRADVISTDIAIRAEGIVWCAVTRTTRAGVAFSTWHTVITGQDVIRVAAAHANCAHVVGADISVRAQAVVGRSVTDTA